MKERVLTRDGSPALWSASALSPWLQALSQQGIFVNYCATADRFRQIQSWGYTVEHLPGPPGKREMLRARRKTSLIA
ncbi:MAG: hypothetical protein ABR98_02305 [Cryomorphaceae bacterium BACL7 MAG-120910-bin2]|nr:MAG: hypothetical protein ABR98_02305 [Cryomorphaceae bacterium BACL7 MAG-120910-bin2]KRO68828.1 MAG: hypothetical protein ABR88_04860 [Cryomorphaceae bacterium BACL7 MAG-120322-bin74]KRO83512.1 MAG: hypothetical protein ABR87_01790 [Cryomorphaceae bacterium BACL7 MAG-121220-bin83]NQW25385.1 hypothetical protein [Cryomorphaceae bacterium]